MPRVGDVMQLLSGTLAVPNTTIQSAPYNAQQQDWVLDANAPRPITAGGTGATTAAGARTSLGAMGSGDLAAAATKAVPVNTDSVVIIDSAAANIHKRWLVSDMKTMISATTSITGKLALEGSVLPVAANTFSLYTTGGISQMGDGYAFNGYIDTSGTATWKSRGTGYVGSYSFNPTSGDMALLRSNATVVGVGTTATMEPALTSKTTGQFVFSGTVSGSQPSIMVHDAGAGAPSLSVYSGSRSLGHGWFEAGDNSLALYSVNLAGTPGSRYVSWDNSTGVMTQNFNALKPGGGDWGTISDSRIKTVLGEYGSGLEQVLGLNPVIYTYNGNDGQPQVSGEAPLTGTMDTTTEFIGLVAQAVEVVMPEMVKQGQGWIDGVAVDDLRTIDSTPLIYALVNAVKELTARLVVLEGKTGGLNG